MEIRADRKPGRDAPLGSQRAILIRLYRYMAEWRGLFCGLLALMAVSLACELALPLVIESAVNAITYANGLAVDYPSLMFSIGLFIFIVALSAGLGSAQGMISAKITVNMSARLRRDAFSSLMDAPVSDFDRMRRGDLMSRIMNDAEMAAGAFTDSFLEIISSLVIVVGCAAIMFMRCASLAAISVGAGAISVIVMGALSRMVLPALLRRQTALGRMNSHIEESLKGFRTCKSGGRMAENRRRMEACGDEYYKCCIRANRLEFLLGPTMLVLGNLSFLLTVVFGARWIISGAIAVGTMQAFIMYSRQFMEPLNAMGDHFVKAQNALAGAERVFWIIDGRKEQSAQVDTDGAPVPDGYLTLEDVRFAYHKNVPVLKGLTLTLQRGERLALVGRTGAGKTTLTHLLLMFYANYEGRICLDGRDIRSMDPAELRRAVAVVSQEPQIIEGTLYDNLVHGCEDVSREEARHAVEVMGIRLPQGLDTPLTDAGEALSQGQLQLICLARAFLRRTPVLILDEATSSMDPDTEYAVRRAMDAAMADRTCIVIAHRLSSVRDADHIAVLSDGAICEYGDHRSLMAENGVYHQLYHTQLLGKEI